MKRGFNVVSIGTLASTSTLRLNGTGLEQQQSRPFSLCLAGLYLQEGSRNPELPIYEHQACGMEAVLLSRCYPCL